MRHSQIDERFAAPGQVFVVFDKPAVFAQPCEGALHNPALGQNLETVGPTGSFITSDNLNEPPTRLPYPCQPFAAICSVRPHNHDARVEAPGKFKQPTCAISVLNTGSSHYYHQHQAHSVYQQVSLASLYPLPSVNSRSRFQALMVEDVWFEGPPFSVVLTDWLSMTAALGWGSLPASMRTCLRSTALICSNNPSSRQMPKYQYTIRQEGKS